MKKEKDVKITRAASKETCRTSSTDIEQTIKKLKKDTDKLLTGDEPISEVEPKLEPKQEHKRPKTKRGSRDSKSKSPKGSEYRARSVKKKERKKDADSDSCCSLHKTFAKKENDKQSAGSSDDFIEESAPKISSQSRIVPDCCARMNKLDMERPITRRNEAEDDLQEDHILDKFRNLPEEGQIVVNSSLEELQAKLQTISESTESMSTPRNKKRMEGRGPVFSKDVKSCACNTERPYNHDKETQSESDNVSIGTLCACPQNSQGSQATWKPKNTLTTYSSIVHAHLPWEKNLNSTNLEPYQISTTSKKDAECQVSVIEVPPVKKKFKCHRCNKELEEEHIEGVSIPSQNNRLKNLTIKVLPPISIDQRMVVTQVLNFFITSQGDTQNLLPETENIAFLVMQMSRADTRSFSEASGNIIEESESNTTNEEDYEDEEEKNISNTNTPGREDPVSPIISLSRANYSRLEAAKPSQFFMRLREGAIKNLDYQDMGDDTPKQKLDEETKKRLLVYKSFNLYDNPNTHDPGGLDAKSAERILGINADFYKTFVNPTGKVSERNMPFRSKSRVLAGFESKEVQCGPSIIFGEEDSSKSLVRQGTSIEKQSTKSLDRPSTSTVKQSTKSLNGPGTSTEKQSIRSLNGPSISNEKPSTKSLNVTSFEKQSTKILDRPSTGTEKQSTKSCNVPANSTEQQSTKSFNRPGTSTEKQSIKSLNEPGTSTKSLNEPGISTEKQSTKSLGKAATSSNKFIFKLPSKTPPPSKQGINVTTYKPSADKESQATLLNSRSIDFGPIPILQSQPKVTHTSSLLPAEHPVCISKQGSEDTSTPSEITVTISFSDSSEGSTQCQSVQKTYGGSREVEIQSTMLGKLKSLESEPKIETETKIDAETNKPSDLEVNESTEPELDCCGRHLKEKKPSMDSVDSEVLSNKILTVKDKKVIVKLQEKLKTVDPNSSDPKLMIEYDSSRKDTFAFIKELARVDTTDNVEDQADNIKKSPKNSQTINYHLIDTNLQPKHLVLAKNGRYKDEENLFAQNPYAIPSCLKRKHESLKPTNENKDQEVQGNKLNLYPIEALNNYSPDTTNSDSVTTNSLSEGEVRCRHSVSNGEIHVCKHGNLFYPTAARNILQRSNLTMNHLMSPQPNITNLRQILPRSNLTNSSNPIRYSSTQRNLLACTLTRVSNSPNRNAPHPRKFDLLDPNLTIEKRRNYFNNWVTYYVKSQDIIESSTSSCSQNK